MLQHRRRQLQQPHVIRNRFARNAHALPDLFLGQSEIAAEFGKCRRLLDAIQVLPLQVFDDSHFRGLLVGNAAHNRRNRRLPRQFRSPAAPFAENQNEASVYAGTHHHGLDHSSRANRIRQFFKRFSTEVGAGLVRILVDQFDRDLNDRIASVRQRRR